MECKYGIHIVPNRISIELIDTLWNVNLNKTSVHMYGGFGINRYIMECKF